VELVSGGRTVEEAAGRLMLPADLVSDAELFRHSADGIYPDNMQIVSVFRGMLTQWIMGPAWPVGLNYVPLDRVMRSRGVNPEDEIDVFEGFQIMERAALQSIREERESR